MKTFTIALSSAETNFAMRANYNFAQEMGKYFQENGMIPGQHLGENVAIFVSVMTKKEIDELKTKPVEEQQQILRSTVKEMKP